MKTFNEENQEGVSTPARDAIPPEILLLYTGASLDKIYHSLVKLQNENEDTYGKLYQL
jgi:hypothetical protein